MSARRLVHTVNSESIDLEMAIALEMPVTAVCGKRWVPIYSGDEVEGLPPCPTCKRLGEPPRKKGGPRRETPTDAPHFVYRFYDSEDRLIYVGCTNNPVARIKSHRKGSWWYPQVARTRIIVFPNRRHALLKEREAIGEEFPRWNVKGRWPYREGRWEAQHYLDFHHAIVQAIETTHGVYGDRSRQLLDEVAAELADRFGVTPLAKRAAS